MSQAADIIPSINVQTFAEAKDRVVKVEPFVTWCHFDVTDGIFSSHPTWREPADLAGLKTTLNAEVHLMIVEPERFIASWLVPPVKRVIVHVESVRDWDYIFGTCREKGIEVGLAIRPDTGFEQFRPWYGQASVLQVLTVPPGPSGQTPDWPKMLEKVMHIREECPKCIIEVDGGINPETAKKARDAGANLFVAGAYIFGSSEIGKAVGELGPSL